ncbi:isopentenyl-diphosphate delta-isomerase [Talaromyces islandicus]|uniref:isopentenyl-diphosphate Delta-isomerase n=1 Tax=Talaromyces islandicus TaxID=28573 RepID=A0A0U1LU09_TALIS|nr:isopentenyl-diphosphate delta-isomerase [Talaromyces islandicus]
MSSTATVTETVPQTVAITAENVATLFPDVDTSLARSILPTAGASTQEGGELEGYDEEQHPLGIAGETGAELSAAIEGVKRAAQRKLDQELGIKAEQVPIDKFEFLTRIHYLAPSDGKWGEHEVDYILFIQADVDVNPNPNEVQDIKYVTPDELKSMFSDPALKFTPWFKLICNSMLFEWWSHFGSATFDKYKGEQDIRRM